jgi:NifU-like protein involved in Fe-S cluster formation
MMKTGSVISGNSFVRRSPARANSATVPIGFKIHCSILAEDAIKAAVQDYKTRHGSDANPSN